MRILRGSRMMMVRLISRTTCHCEMCATCFPEGGVPTVGMLGIVTGYAEVWEWGRPCAIGSTYVGQSTINEREMRGIDGGK